MQAYMADPATAGRIAATVAVSGHDGKVECWPPANVWLGVTTENQKEAERRLPILLQTPAAVRFIAAEPLLSAVDQKPEWLPHAGAAGATIDWVMAGGESGPNARPVALDWVRTLRDQCARSATPFYWNGWGALMPNAPDRREHDARGRKALPRQGAARGVSASGMKGGRLPPGEAPQSAGTGASAPATADGCQDPLGVNRRAGGRARRVWLSCIIRAQKY